MNIKNEAIFFDTIDNSKFYELTANTNIGDSLSISGRFSDFNKHYTIKTHDDKVLVNEKKAPVNYIKANFAKSSGKSHWNLTTYFQDINHEQVYPEGSIKEEFRIFYGEFLWDHRILDKGLITAGLSYRENHIKGAVSTGGFISDIPIEDSTTFYELKVGQVNYENNLKSIFSQYRHPFYWGEFWIGFRFDDNSMYGDYTSYTLGLNIPLPNNWRLKTAYGTGYRSPYSKQLDNEVLDSDEISTINLQAQWRPDNTTLFSITSYYSSVHNHILPDPQAGVSEPSDQSFAGVELYFKKRFNDKFELYSSLTKLFHFGDDYNFSMISNYYLRVDGTLVPEYKTWTKDYDTGADLIFSSGLIWHINSKIDFSLTGIFTSSVPYSYYQDTISGNYHNPLLLNSEIKIKDFPLKNIILSLGCKNLLDEEFLYSGYYGPVEGIPLILYTSIELDF